MSIHVVISEKLLLISYRKKINFKVIKRFAMNSEGCTFDFMKINIENSIFRYRSDDFTSTECLGNTLNEILENKIWHSTIGNLNDPFEVYFVRDENDIVDLSRNDMALILSNAAILNNKYSLEYVIKSFLNNDLKSLYNDINDAVNYALPSLRDKFRRYVALASFTQIADSRLMWGYYCSGFRGVCLIYNKQKLESAGLTLSKVHYSSTPPKARLSEWIVKQKRNLPLNDMLDFAKTKHIDWVGEQEYRSLSFMGHEDAKQQVSGQLIKLSSNCIDGIIIGEHYHPSALNIILEYATKNNINIYYASADLDNYKVKVSL